MQQTTIQKNKSGRNNFVKQAMKIFNTISILCFLVSIYIFFFYTDDKCTSNNNLSTNKIIRVTDSNQIISNLNLNEQLQNHIEEGKTGLHAEFDDISLNTVNCSSFPSQHGEDYFVFKAFFSNPKPMTNGIYLESGAWDGKSLSNSYFFQYCLGWKGILVEAHPVAASACKINRPDAIVIDEAICKTTNGTITLVGDPNGLSGDKDYVTENYLKQVKRNSMKEYTVKCNTINNMLEDHSIEMIDFWTLDIEGAEMMVLESYDWKRFPVHVLIIENDKNEAVDKPIRHKILKENGFELRGSLVNNELWVNPKNARKGISERVVGWHQLTDYISGIEELRVIDYQ